MNHIYLYSFILAAGLIIAQQSIAKAIHPFADTTFVTSLGDTTNVFEMPQITVLGQSNNALKTLPGTYSKVSTINLRQIEPITANEILRKVPGLNIVDEEGAGLRLNIGVRGLDPDRSRNILILEDGIPVALNPYGEPELYFSPSIDRMSGVEVLKGSGQLLFGPQTIGGVVNFVTQDPPETATTNIRLRGGQYGYFSGYASHGNSNENAGYVVNVLHKRADNLGPTQFELTDINAKFRLVLSDKSRLGLKLGVYNEQSNSTYIGLTQTMFDAGSQDFVHMAPDDHLIVKRISGSITHDYFINDNIKLKTTGFGYTTTRNWQRQDFSTNPDASNQTGVVWGDEQVPGGAIYMIDGTGNRNRSFEVAGMESSLQVNGYVGEMKNQLRIGARYLFERAFEQRVNGSKSDAASGVLRDDEIRTGTAFSAYVQDQIHINDRLTFTGGVRLEQYNMERHILRGRYEINGVQQIRDTSIIADNSILAFIPGIGTSYQITNDINVFAGVHRGFAPPRVKDAITPQGESIELDAELSTNSELGIRYMYRDALSLELTGFIMNFENQIIPISQSSGNLNETGFANGGETLHRGIEVSGSYDFSDWFGSRHMISLELATTYVRSRYNADRFVGPDGTNVNGNALPYAPEWTFWGGLNIKFDWGLGLNFNGSFVDQQFTDELNTLMPHPGGRIGLIDSRFTVDGGIYYTIKDKNITIRLMGKNLTNTRFIATRRPQGIRVGLPRMILGGVDFSF